MNHFESSVINLIWTKKLVLLYKPIFEGNVTLYQIGSSSNIVFDVVYAKNPKYICKY
jgi:hypothetical protein